MSEKFNLKWNDFQTNVSKSFGLFRNEEYLHDVTLVSDDFKQMKAHKLVLSACSEYFKRIFQETSSSYQTLLCLDGVNSSNLSKVLDYVYDGEVKILQEDLDTFLCVAQKLQLQGLIHNDDENHQNEANVATDNIEETFSKEEKIIVGQANTRTKAKDTFKHVPKTDMGTLALNDNSLPDTYIGENMIINQDETVSCKICNRSFRGKDRKSYLKNHLETHVEGLSYTCPLCDKTFRSKNSLSVHRSVYHKSNQKF